MAEALVGSVGLVAVAIGLAWLSCAATALAGGATPVVAGLRPAREGVRLLRQRRRRTVAADLHLWRAGGWALVPSSVLMLALVPLGSRPALTSDVGVVWANALDVAVWAFVWLLGWGANSVVSLVGGYRFLALALGYELPLMFALVAPALAAQSLDLEDVARAQSDLWFVTWMPVAFLVYVIGVLGFSTRGPMSASVGREIGGGVLAELNSVDLLVVRWGRHALLGAGSALAVPLFLGGGAGPWLAPWAWVLLKAALLTVALAWTAARLPTARPHLLMQPLWTFLLPAVVVQDLLVGVILVGGR